MTRIAIIGASGAIGAAFVEQLATRDDTADIYAFSRSVKIFGASKVTSFFIDLTDEASIEEAAIASAQNAPLDLVIVASGLLHDGALQPEKALRDLSAERFQRLFALNTIGPALVAKHFLPKLARDRRAVFAALSARVGSISDNRLGGWYAYRASKAALNMVLKNASIEMARRAPQAIVIGLHPGTVKSGLSAPFQDNVSADKLFEPAYATARMIEVLEGLSPTDTGKCFAYDGTEVLP